MQLQGNPSLFLQNISTFHLFSLRFAARYFSSAPPVFQRLFFTSEQSAAVHYGPRRMKLRDLMAATLRFLQSDCARFRMLWDWSPCVSQLLVRDAVVRGYGPVLVSVTIWSLMWEVLTVSHECFIAPHTDQGVQNLHFFLSWLLRKMVISNKVEIYTLQTLIILFLTDQC